MQKKICNNPKLDLAKILSGNEILAQIKHHNSRIKVRKMTCNNPMLDLVNMNAYIKFGEKCHFVLKIFSGNKFGCKSRAITLVQICEK